MRPEELTAGILAGGKSSRMGKNKARLHLAGDGRSFLERIAAQMDGFSQVLVSVNDTKTYRDLPWRLVQDELQGFGPVEGLYQLLQAAETPYVLAVATDMPFLQRSLLTALAGCVPKGESAPACVVLRRGGKPEPLCSIYGKQCLPALEQMRRDGEHRMRLLYDRVDTRYVDLEDLGFSASCITNINTPEELRGSQGAAAFHADPTSQ